MNPMHSMALMVVVPKLTRDVNGVKDVNNKMTIKA
jgi:hypothetical protein